MLEYNLRLWLTLLVAAVAVSSSEEQSRQPLYVMMTGPYPDPMETGWDAGISLIPAARLAFEQINQDSTILQNYTLKLIEEDSGCRSGDSFPSKVFLSYIRGTHYNSDTQRNRPLAIIGPACSDTALAIAPFLARPEVNLIQIAPTATSPMIETLNYNTTFTMIASSLIYIESIIKLMECNQWFKVGVFFEALGSIFNTAKERFEQRVANLSGYEIGLREPVINNDEENVFIVPLEELKESRVRVVVVFGGTNTVQKTLCLAFHQNMVYPQYQWIFSERSLANFNTSFDFKYNGEVYNCTREQMARAANGSILNTYSLSSEDNATLPLTGQNYSMYRNLYMEKFSKHKAEDRVQRIIKVINDFRKKIDNFDPSGTPWENTYYDAGWALGLALNQLSKKGYKLSSTDQNFTQSLSAELLNVSFRGATGLVNFNKATRSVKTTILAVSQLHYNHTTNMLYTRYLTNYTAGNLTCPAKHFFINYKFDEIPEQIHVSLGVLVLLLTTILTILVVSLQIVFILWHRVRSIKAVSPTISTLMFSGCYLFALATVAHTIQEAFSSNIKLEVFYPVMCSVVMWCLMLGSSLILGTVFVKIWRVFRIFKHFRNKSPGVLLHDNALIVGVMVLVVIDILVCLSWILVSPWQISQDLNPIPNSQVLLVHSRCTCQYIEYWIAGVSIYKGGLALMLVVLSILNRKIQRKHFSHTKKINILVYSLTVLGGIGFPMYFLLRNTSIYVPYLVICSFFILTMLLCCLLLFIPPVIPLLKVKLGITDTIQLKKSRNAKSLTTPQDHEKFQPTPQVLLQSSHDSSQ